MPQHCSKKWLKMDDSWYKTSVWSFYACCHKTTGTPKRIPAYCAKVGRTIQYFLGCEVWEKRWTPFTGMVQLYHPLTATGFVKGCIRLGLLCLEDLLWDNTLFHFTCLQWKFDLQVNDLLRCLFFTVHSSCTAPVSTTGPFVWNSFSLAGSTEASWLRISDAVQTKRLTVKTIGRAKAWGAVQPKRGFSLSTVKQR